MVLKRKKKQRKSVCPQLWKELIKGLLCFSFAKWINVNPFKKKVKEKFQLKQLKKIKIFCCVVQQQTFSFFYKRNKKTTRGSLSFSWTVSFTFALCHSLALSLSWTFCLEPYDKIDSRFAACNAVNVVDVVLLLFCLCLLYS